MIESKFEASVGMSRKWDAREAGREVAENTIKNLSRPPDFFLLFSTIHYGKHGGFQEFLNGVWDVLPKGIPLVGGTVAGFMNPQGCYTRGAAGLAVCCYTMDAVSASCKRTKINPKSAVKNVANDLAKDTNFKYENKLILNFIPSSTVFDLPGMGKINLTNSRILSMIITSIGWRLSQFFGYGWGREDEIIPLLKSKFPNHYMLGGSCMDNGKVEKTYQFHDTKVSKNSLVCLGISTDNRLNINSTCGLRETRISFKVSKLKARKRIIFRIDGKPAKKTLFTKIGWDEASLKELDKLYRTTFYLPLGRIDKNKQMHPYVIGGFFNDAILVDHMIKDDTLSLFSSSGKAIHNAVSDLLERTPNGNCVFGSACEVELETIGNKINFVKELFDSRFKEIPYLVCFFGGENYSLPQTDANILTHSYNLVSFMDV